MHMRRLSPRERVVTSLAGLTLVSTLLFLAGAIASGNFQLSYLLSNLFLAWLPFAVMVALLRSLHTQLWSSWRPLALTLLWLAFLPNSFYMISDFIHLQDVAHHNLLYDVIVFTACIFTAAALGFSSLYMVHAELKKRISMRASSLLVGIIIFLCSFGIYLGRDLRWNSWDILLNPAGILFDVSDNLIHPLQNGDMFTTTISFFVLLSSLYIVGWQVGEATHEEAAL